MEKNKLKELNNNGFNYVVFNKHKPTDYLPCLSLSSAIREAEFLNGSTNSYKIVLTK